MANRNNNSYECAPHSRADLRRAAHLVREKAKVSKREKFDVVKFLEHDPANLGIELEVVDVKEMGLSKEAETYPDQKLIRVRIDVYEKAINGDGRSRFTLSHELGHFLFHKQMNVRQIGNSFARGEALPAYKNPEWQANVFAAELLAPSDYIAGMSVDEVSNRYGISWSCAEIQLKQSHHLS